MRLVRAGAVADGHEQLADLLLDAHALEQLGDPVLMTALALAAAGAPAGIGLGGGGQGERGTGAGEGGRGEAATGEGILGTHGIHGGHDGAPAQ